MPCGHSSAPFDTCTRDAGARETRAASAVLLVYLHLGERPDWPWLRAVVYPSSAGPSRKARHRRADVNGSDQLHRGLDVLVRNVERDRADLLRLFRALDRALDEGAGTALTLTPDELFEEVLRRTGTTPVFGRSTMTSASLADAIAAVAAVERRQRVLDPASGEGSLLLSVARSAPSALLEGREKDDFSWAVSVVRLELHGVKAELTPLPSLGGPALSRADVVVLDPPLDNRREYVEWLRLALSALEPRGRAVVALPAFAADPARREWKDVGSVHATSLVHLPGRLRSDAGQPLVLWVLSPEEAEGDLREVDARELGERRATQWVLSKGDVQGLRFAASATRPLDMHSSHGRVPVTHVSREAGSVLAGEPSPLRRASLHVLPAGGKDHRDDSGKRDEDEFGTGAPESAVTQASRQWPELSGRQDQRAWAIWLARQLLGRLQEPLGAEMPEGLERGLHKLIESLERQP